LKESIARMKPTLEEHDVSFVTRKDMRYSRVIADDGRCVCESVDWRKKIRSGCCAVGWVQRREKQSSRDAGRDVLEHDWFHPGVRENRAQPRCKGYATARTAQRRAQLAEIQDGSAALETAVIEYGHWPAF
jgi:hypothetical protein